MGFPEFILCLAAIAAGAGVLMSPVAIVRMILKHRERIAQIRNSVEGGAELAAQIAALRHEVGELRETSTRFDMSFDAALARVEERLSVVEQEQSRPKYQQAPAEETQTVFRR